MRSLYADWERGDFSSVEWADPDIEYVIVGGPSPGSWTGLGGMAEGFRDFLGGLEGYRLQAVEYRELEADHVIAITTNTGHGKTSGLDLGTLTGGRGGVAVFHVRDGRVAKLTFYWDRDRALADLGLEG